MSSSLVEYLDAAGRELRRAAILRGTAWMLAALTAGLLLAGTLDYFTHGNGDFWRGFLSLVAFLPAILIGGVFVLWPLVARPKRLELARRIERADPSLDGALVSATAFLDPRDTYGSTALQRETLAAATARINSDSTRPLVNWARVARAGWVGGTLLVLAVLVLAYAPASATTALARLARPFTPIEWPRRVDLRLLDESGEPLTNPVVISQGQAFRFFVANTRGNLPADLTLETRGPDGRLRRQPVPTAEAAPPGFASPGSDDRLGVASIFAGEGPLRFRVTGGDDRRMPFLTAKVVVPPRLEDFVVTVDPPDYLQSETTTTPAGVARVRGVVGSDVTIRARASKPLAAAALFVGDEPGPGPMIRDHGRQVIARFVLGNERSSSYWFRLRDRSGLENPRAPRYEISTTIDKPPEVTLPEPAENATATPEATLAISVGAADDFGLTDVRLRYGPGTRLPAANSAEVNQISQTISLLEDRRRPREFQRDIAWPLAGLGLEIGDQLTLRAEALDAYDLGLPRLAASAPRTVTIVSPETKRAALRDAQATLLSELWNAHRATLRLRQAAGTLAADLARANKMEAPHHDRMARLELEGRRLAEHLVGPDQSSEATARTLLAEMEANRISDAAMKARLQTIVDELSTLRENAMAAANRQITAARKSAGPADAAGALQAASGELTIVAEGLAALIDSLGAWRNRRNVLSAVRDLIQSQKNVVEETTHAAAETLGTQKDQLTSEQRERLQSLAKQQDNLAERFDRLSQKLQPTANHSRENDETSDSNSPSAARDPLLRAAAERLRSTALPAAARAAGESIRANRLGEAGQRQSDILAELDGLREILSQRTNPAPAKVQLKQLREELSSLASQQEALLETLVKRKSDQGKQPDSQQALLRAQGNLRARTAAAARTARDAGAVQASNSLRSAASAMARGLERLRRQADREAEKELAEALQQIREASRRMGSERAGQQTPLAKPISESTVGRVQGLAERQAALNQEIIRLEKLKHENGSLTRAQLLSLRETQSVQTTISEQTDTLRRELGESVVIQYVLEAAIAEMRAVAERLAKRDTGQATQNTAARALARLREILAAVKAMRDRDISRQSQAAAAENPKSGGSPPQLVQLELLRLWQVDLKQRTHELENNLNANGPTSAQAEELTDIAGELAAIRELTASLLSNTLLRDGKEQ